MFFILLNQTVLELPKCFLVIMVWGGGEGRTPLSPGTEHRHLKVDANLKVAISLFTKYTVSQKQLRFYT